jgi:GNAT superfamily N-acetyltransferase
MNRGMSPSRTCNNGWPLSLTVEGIQFITWREASTHEHFWTKLIDLQRATMEGWPDPDPDGEITRQTDEQARRMFDAWQATPDNFWLAQANDLYVGYSALGPDDSAPETIGTGPTAVRPEYRGRGIATALKAICLNRARARVATRHHTFGQSRDDPRQREIRLQTWAR